MPSGYHAVAEDPIVYTRFAEVIHWPQNWVTESWQYGSTGYTGKHGDHSQQATPIAKYQSSKVVLTADHDDGRVLSVPLRHVPRFCCSWRCAVDASAVSCPPCWLSSSGGDFAKTGCCCYFSRKMSLLQFSSVQFLLDAGRGWPLYPDPVYSILLVRVIQYG